MSQHLDLHFKLNKRQALIQQQSGGVQSQGWYWDESEWIHAPDVIFGVQTRNPAGMAPKATDEAEGADKQPFKIVPQSVVADEAQKKCTVKKHENKTERTAVR